MVDPLSVERRIKELKSVLSEYLFSTVPTHRDKPRRTAMHQGSSYGVYTFDFMDRLTCRFSDPVLKGGL